MSALPHPATILVFHVGDMNFCVDTAQVVAVLEFKPLTPLPKMPEFMAGVCRWQGEVVTIIDLRVVFKLPPRPPGDSGCFITSRLQGEILGFWVDAVSDVIEAHHLPWQILPPACATSYMDRALTHEQRLIMLLDFARLLERHGVSLTDWDRNLGGLFGDRGRKPEHATNEIDTTPRFTGAPAAASASVVAMDSPDDRTTAENKVLASHPADTPGAEIAGSLATIATQGGADTTSTEFDHAIADKTTYTAAVVAAAEAEGFAIDTPATGTENHVIAENTLAGGQPAALADTLAATEATTGDITGTPIDTEPAAWVDPTAVTEDFDASKNATNNSAYSESATSADTTPTVQSADSETRDSSTTTENGDPETITADLYAIKDIGYATPGNILASDASDTDITATFQSADSETLSTCTATDHRDPANLSAEMNTADADGYFAPANTLSTYVPEAAGTANFQPADDETIDTSSVTITAPGGATHDEITPAGVARVASETAPFYDHSGTAACTDDRDGDAVDTRDQRNSTPVRNGTWIADAYSADTAPPPAAQGTSAGTSNLIDHRAEVPSVGDRGDDSTTTRSEEPPSAGPGVADPSPTIDKIHSFPTPAKLTDTAATPPANAPAPAPEIQPEPAVAEQFSWDDAAHGRQPPSRHAYREVQMVPGYLRRHRRAASGIAVGATLLIVSGLLLTLLPKTPPQPPEIPGDLRVLSPAVTAPAPIAKPTAKNANEAYKANDANDSNTANAANAANAPAVTSAGEEKQKIVIDLPTHRVIIEREAGGQRPGAGPVTAPGSDELLGNGPASDAGFFIHEVRRGDTLWRIAKQYLDNPYLYPQLARASDIRNPNLIYPGDRVRIENKERPDLKQTAPADR